MVKKITIIYLLIDCKFPLKNNGFDIKLKMKLIGGVIMDGHKRSNIKKGLKVKVVQKKDQRNGNLTEGVVQRILTNSASHPHGIKVMLENGKVGRVKKII